MTTSFSPGPSSEIGIRPPLSGPTNPLGGSAQLSDQNPDAAPGLYWMGSGVRDPEYQPNPGGAANVKGSYSNQDIAWYWADGLFCVDQVPSTASNTNIAGNQTVANGTAMTLAGASTGITLVATGGYVSLCNGLVVPANALVLDGLPQWLGAGQSGAFAFFDPTRGIARCVSVTAAAGATGGVVQVKGFDVYGRPLTQNITAVAGTTVNSLKAFKYILSAVPQFTDGSHNYSVGTADVFGMNVRCDRFTYAEIAWDTSWITNNTGFTAPDLTNPATATTGDTRGTFATPTASNGTRRLFMGITPTLANVLATGGWASAVTGIKGITQV